MTSSSAAESRPDPSLTAAGPESESQAAGAAGGGDNVIGDRVITEDGTELGSVVDVVVSVRSGAADIVGFEVATSAHVDPEGGIAFVPMPAATAMSGEAIAVPARVGAHLSRDLDGLRAAVAELRRQTGDH